MVVISNNTTKPTGSPDAVYQLKRDEERRENDEKVMVEASGRSDSCGKQVVIYTCSYMYGLPRCTHLWGCMVEAAVTR